MINFNFLILSYIRLVLLYMGDSTNEGPESINFGHNIFFSFQVLKSILTSC